MGVDVELSLREHGADAARLDVLHRQFRDGLRNVDHVDASPHGPTGGGRALGHGVTVPPGARAVDPATVSTLAVAVLGSGGLTAVIASARSWLARAEHTPRSVRLEVSGDVLELTGASTSEQNRLVELFLARHEPQQRDPRTS